MDRNLIQNDFVGTRLKNRVVINPFAEASKGGSVVPLTVRQVSDAGACCEAVRIGMFGFGN